MQRAFLTYLYIIESIVLNDVFHSGQLYSVQFRQYENINNNIVYTFFTTVYTVFYSGVRETERCDASQPADWKCGGWCRT